MTIHHSTIKSAASKGVILTQEGDIVSAHNAQAGVKVSLDTEGVETISEITELAKTAWANVSYIADFHAERDDIRIIQEDADFVAYKHGKTGKLGDEIARDPELEDLFTTLAEAGDSGDEEDQDEKTGTVVPNFYKKKYAAEGHAGHCGDWLAVTLNELCQVTDGKKVTTDLDRLEAIATANDVTPDRVDKLGTATNGWQGRYRMTVRNMLTKKVAAKGFLFVPEGCGVKTDTEKKAPKAWCEMNAPKDKPKKAPKAAVSKDEGAGKKSLKTIAAQAAAESAIQKRYGTKPKK